mgnify:CR=1 FL=1
MPETNEIKAIFEFRADLSKLYDLYERGLIKVVFPGVKPYLSTATVERVLKVIRGKRLDLKKLDYWAKRVGVSLTNFRRLISQYVMMGFAKMGRTRVYIDPNAPAVPVIVNNTTPGHEAGVRPGTTKSWEVLEAIWYLRNNGIELNYGAPERPLRISVWVMTTLYSSQYIGMIRWDEKSKGSAVDREVDIMTSIWVPSFEAFEELHETTDWWYELDDVLKFIDRNRMTDYHMWFEGPAEEEEGEGKKGYGVLPLDRIEGIEVLDTPLEFQQVFIGIAGGPGDVMQYRAILKEPLNVFEYSQPVVVKLERL